MRKILVVEDESALRQAYGLMLSREPYVTHLAANGKEALELCEDHVYDLILLDLMMPELNGVEFLKLFSRKKPDITKIIILSNLSSGKELAKALDLGAYKSAVKANLTPNQLLTMVRYEVEAQ